MEPQVDLDRIETLLADGLFVEALRVGERTTPWRAWPGARGQELAGRVADATGAPRLGSAIHLRAARIHPSDGSLRSCAALARLHDHGPVAALAVLAAGVESEPDPRVRARLHAARAAALARLRDFEGAEQDLRIARELDGFRPWLGVSEAWMLLCADRYAEALATVERVLDLQPSRFQAIGLRAHLLQLEGRPVEALESLLAALATRPSAPLAGMCATILMDLERDGDALRALQIYEECAPLSELRSRRWVAASRSELAWRRGDQAAAIEYARAVDEEFLRRMRDSVARGSGVRRQIAVPFVRQHHETCGPATLTALVRALGHDAAHLEIVERISWGGTTALDERRWAEEQGFLVREFTVTWDGLRGLIDRGLPFGINTVEAGTAHMQAVVGYDSRRETLLVRDPYQPELRIWQQAEFFARYSATGPRGLLVVPESRGADVADLVLHEADLHDALHRVQKALKAHDRAAASREVEALRECAPRSYPTLAARLALAEYDQDPIDEAGVIAEWLSSAPTCERFVLLQADLLAREERLSEVQAVLERMSAVPGHDSLFDVRLAEVLARDARRASVARGLLRRALRRNPLDARAFWVLADLHEHAGDRARAIEALRFSMCLGESVPEYAERFAALCLAEGRGAEAFALLAARAARAGARSSRPARSLASALERAGRVDEARAALERALGRMPGDGDLSLAYARFEARCGRLNRARELLADAEPRVRPTDARRARAEVALASGDIAAALEHARATLDLGLQDEAALDLYLQLALATEGPRGRSAAARAALDARPHDVRVRRGLCLSLGTHDPAAAVVELQTLLERHPEDAWARRELALRLAESGRFDEAEAEAREALARYPGFSGSHGVLGHVLRMRGRVDEARAAFARACELDVENGGAVQAALALALDDGAGPAVVQEIGSRLASHAIQGSTIEIWAAAARDVLAPEALLEGLRSLRTQRPDLADSHRVLAGTLRSLDRLPEAREVAREAVARFPLARASWMELAEIERELGGADAEQEALGRAAEVGPADGVAFHALGKHLLRRGAREEAQACLEAAVRAGPLAVEHHAALAEAIVAAGRPTEALECADRLVALLPLDGRAWDVHARCAVAAGQPRRTLELLESAVAAHPAEPQIRILLARHLPLEEDVRRQQLLRGVLDQASGDFEALDLLAEVLDVAGRSDEALALVDRYAVHHRGAVYFEGRRAVLAVRCGWSEDGVRALAALVDRRPGYRWGVDRLDELLAQSGQHAERARRIADLLRREPRNAALHDKAGQAAAHAGDRAAAERAYRRALELEPGRWTSILDLVDLLAARGALDEARSVAQTIASDAPAFARPRAEARIHCAVGDARRAAEIVKEAADDPRIDERALVWIAGPLLEAGHFEGLIAALEAIALGPRGSASCARLWAHAHVRGQRREMALARLDALSPLQPGWAEAAALLVEDAIEAKAWPAALALVERHAEVFRRSPDLWALAGRLHTAAGRKAEQARWTADWRRADARPWMLLLPALVRADNRDYAGTREIADHALGLPADHTTRNHAAIAAAMCALHGDLEGARARLSLTPHGARHDGLFASLAVLVGIALAALDAPDRRACIRTAARELEAHEKVLDEHHGVRLVMRVRRACLRAVARRRGTWWAHVWALLRTVG